MSPHDVRLVPMTREQLQAILQVFSGQTVSPYVNNVLDQLEASFEAAPADPAEAVQQIIMRYRPDWADEGLARPGDIIEWKQDMARAVLAALGCAKEPA